MPDDFFVTRGDQVEPFNAGVQRPDGLNDVDLLLFVVPFAGEGGTDGIQNPTAIRWLGRSNQQVLVHERSHDDTTP